MATECAAGCGIGCGAGVLSVLLGQHRTAQTSTDDDDDDDVEAPPPQTYNRKDTAHSSFVYSTMVGKNSKALTFQRRTSLNVDNEDLNQLKMKLETAGIDTSVFGKGTAKTLEELFYELNVTRESKLHEDKDGTLKRLVKVVSVDLIVQDYVGQWQHLVSTTQFLRDGRQRNRRDVISRKIHEGETWEDAVSAAFIDRVALARDVQVLHLIMPSTPPECKEIKGDSQGFPGLQATYNFYKVKVMVKDPTHPDLRCIGLPDCRDFVTVRDTSDEGVMFGTNLRMWAWEACEAPCLKPTSSAPTKASTTSTRKRCPLPDIPDMPPQRPIDDSNFNKVLAPNPKLCELLANARTDWSRAKKAASRIRDADYSLRMFFDDCVGSFPEMSLYLADSSLTTSGRTGDDEYQRTVGALFAVYWMMRLDIDGKEGFCFGVDNDWRPRGLPSDQEGGSSNQADDDKREQFYRKTNWAMFTELLVFAGLLVEENGTYSTCLERCLAMLALTAIHDVMKVPVILPTVQPEHAPFKGFKESDIINDHDIALGYVLENFPSLLPSFSGLPARQRQAIEFTQSKMDYNMGWLVQAEAPPGKLFGGFKALLQSGGVASTDVSFYFTHWLTDLAGAEPYPLEGSEKFVLRFPHAVLHGFLRSFPVVQELAHRTETDVFENYLCMRWSEATELQLPELPTGNESIVQLRLLLQAGAGASAKAVLEAFKTLTEEERKILATEMARTGCPDQRYARASSSSEDPMGPAMLVYYAPALLGKFGREEAQLALRRLCEVYRQARALWPAEAGKAGDSVTVRIDTIKDRSNQQIRDAMVAGNVFVLVKHNAREAFVEMHPISALNDLCDSSSSFRFMRLA